MKWLLDEMLPAAACEHLVVRGHDALSVRGAGLGGAEDDRVFDWAVHEQRIIVTENSADYAVLLEHRVARGAQCVPVVFVHKRDFPRRGSLATTLARPLDEWARANPDPYVGPHWL